MKKNNKNSEFRHSPKYSESQIKVKKITLINSHHKIDSVYNISRFSHEKSDNKALYAKTEGHLSINKKITYL